MSAYVAEAATVAAEPAAAGAPRRFRCGFCKRVYPAKTAAQECAAACKAATQKSIEVERSVRPQELAAATPAAAAPAAPVKEKKKAVVRRDQGHKFLRDGRKLVCRKCGKESMTLDEVIACYDAHPVKEKKAKGEKSEIVVVKTPMPAPVVAAPEPVVVAAPVAAEPAPEPAAAAPAPTKAPSADDDHKFRRDGARYVCRSCSKKFFTRGDVVQCFDSHAAA